MGSGIVVREFGKRDWGWRYLVFDKSYVCREEGEVNEKQIISNFCQELEGRRWYGSGDVGE